MAADPVPEVEYFNPDDGSCRWFRADLFDLDSAASEMGLLIDEVKVTEEWFVVRWTTPEERADEDRLCRLFGADWEDCDTSVCVETATAETPGALRYWRVTEAPTTRAEAER